MLRIAKTESGIVQGLPAADPRITSYKGIPFAAPPVGRNRWRAPQPVASWSEPLKAFDFGPAALQPPTVIDEANIYTREWSVDPEQPMDEDCLYLNVWTPAKQSDEKLPVFVWYFGGGLQVGHPAEMEFDGERIARRGIVVVTVNYRLNAFGFLCHPDITAEAPEAPANFGHLDQQFGTQWVKRNIAAFGGDPDNITIGGQSAGGGSVMSQLTSPQNEGLFQQAIVESGIITKLYDGNRVPGTWLTLAQAEQEGVKFFAYLRVRTLEQARRIPSLALRDKVMAYGAFWGTVVDSQFCVANPFDRFVRNERWMVPVMMGHTSDEFYNGPVVDSVDTLREMAVRMFGDNAQTYLELIGADQGTIEEICKRASVRIIEYSIRLAAQASERAGSKAPLYYYNFDPEIPGWDNPGTFHSVDLWFFFETLAKCWRPFTGKHYDLARQMCNYWCHFIRTGNPNGDDSTGELLPTWDAYSETAPYGMLFGDTTSFSREEPTALMKFLVDQRLKTQA